jgi:hypothetical protein
VAYQSICCIFLRVQDFVNITCIAPNLFSRSNLFPLEWRCFRMCGHSLKNLDPTHMIICYTFFPPSANPEHTGSIDTSIINNLCCKIIFYVTNITTSWQYKGVILLSIWYNYGRKLWSYGCLVCRILYENG